MAVRAVHTSSPPLAQALELPNGARFFRSALQVNPFTYMKRHAKATSFKTERDYNDAIIAACVEHSIEVIGVTDHYRVDESWGLLKAARESGLFAFAGFEAVSKDGVHFLCLFDVDQESNLERIIGECGIPDKGQASPIGSMDALELMERAAKWKASCIAAHAISEGGLLRKLSGQTRINAWCSNYLLACAIAGPVDSTAANFRPILENKDVPHKRARPVAVVNASDVNGPGDLAKEGASTLIKMSVPSIEALRQAFLDPESRIRLNSAPAQEPHAEFLALSWEGGFLDGVALHFNSNLNVLIGGRGAGKSTIVESIRYVLGLEPVGDDAKKTHEGVTKHVLRPGTKVSLLVRSHKPSEANYTIERSIPNRPVVKDRLGNVLTLSPKDVLADVQVFGQHEISELTKSREKLTLLLDRFVEHDTSLSHDRSELELKLQRSRARLVGLLRESRQVDDRLAVLPALEETLKRFQEAGLEARLKEKSQLVREERLFKTAAEKLEPFRDELSNLQDLLPIDLEFLSSRSLKGMPNAVSLARLRIAMDSANASLLAATKELETALASTDESVSDVNAQWTKRRQTVETAYEKILRDLQKSKVDGQEFIRLRQQIEDLRPLAERRQQLKRDLSVHETQRRTLLAKWQDSKDRGYQEIQAAAKNVSRKLRDRVRVAVTMSGNREPLEQLLREKVGGNISIALEKLRSLEPLSLSDLAERAREGKGALMKHYGLPIGFSERLAGAEVELFMLIEELDLPA
ncbi:MAG: AAA family ATPase, partial [Planctomycetota bacterium]